MATDVSTLAQAALQGRVDLLNAGPENPKLQIFDNSSPTPVLLIEFDLGTIGNATNACPSVASPSVPIDGTAVAGDDTAVNTATLFDGNGVAQREYGPTDLGPTGAGRPIELSDITVTNGQAFRLTTCNFRQPC